MLEWFPLAIALGGSSIAAAYDLKTTEIPDRIPYLMAVFGLAYYLSLSIVQSNFSIIGLSIFYGLIMTAIGFVLYYFGQWGGGDAKLLGSIALLLPTNPTSNLLIFPFPVTFFINLFLIGAVYMIFYSLVFSLMNKTVIKSFLTDIKASANVIIFGSSSLLILFVGLNLYLFYMFQSTLNLIQAVSYSLIPFVVSVSLFILWRFARIVEKVGFRKKIPISRVKVGDVLFEFKQWEGITEKQLKKLKRSGKKSVWIKEGIRFAAAFPLALLFSVYLGEGILLVLNTVI